MRFCFADRLVTGLTALVVYFRLERQRIIWFARVYPHPGRQNCKEIYDLRFMIYDLPKLREIVRYPQIANHKS